MVDNAICGQELTQSFTKSCHAIWVDIFYHEKLSWATTTTKWQILGWTCHKQEMQDKEKHSESAILVLPLLEFSCMTPQCPSQEYWVLTGAKLCKLCYIIHHQLFVNYIIQLQCKKCKTKYSFSLGEISSIEGISCELCGKSEGVCEWRLGFTRRSTRSA